MLYSLGSINLDVQVRAPHWPRHSETVPAEDCLITGGGKGANVAVLARRLGVPASLFGCVGDDALAPLALESLEDQGIDLSRLARARGATTGVAMIVVRPDGDKTIVLATNANQQWPPQAGPSAAAAIARAPSGSVLVVDLEVPPEVVESAIEAARARGVTVVLDPSPARRVPRSFLPRVDFITPNPREAQHLTGIEVDGEAAARKAAERLRALGVGAACVKLANGGCALAQGEQARTIKPLVVDEVVDTTGAGDAFAGALGAALHEGVVPLRAVHQAVAAASLAVTGYGSRSAYPDRAALASALARMDAADG